MSWLCSCGLLNASANQYCAGIKTPGFTEHNQISPSTYDITLYWTAERRVKELMTPNEELHAKFFSEEAALVINLNDIELEEHIQELEMIIREGKARVIAASEERKNRRAKKGSKGEWQIAPTGPDVTVTDAINKVKQRSSRMSKLDKIRDKLAALGISDNEIDQMVSKMVAQARKDKPDTNPVNTGIVSDAQREAAKVERKREDDEVSEVSSGTAVPLIQPITVDIPESKPIDMSKLKSLFKK